MKENERVKVIQDYVNLMGKTYIILLSSLGYLMMTKVYGTGLWVSATVVALFVGFRVAKKRAPELAHVSQTDNPLQMILDLAEAPGEKLDIYFKRPLEGGSVADPTVAFRKQLFELLKGSPMGGFPIAQFDLEYAYSYGKREPHFNKGGQGGITQ